MSYVQTTSRRGKGAEGIGEAMLQGTAVAEVLTIEATASGSLLAEGAGQAGVEGGVVTATGTGEAAAVGSVTADVTKLTATVTGSLQAAGSGVADAIAKTVPATGSGEAAVVGSAQSEIVKVTATASGSLQAEGSGQASTKAPIVSATGSGEAAVTGSASADIVGGFVTDPMTRDALWDDPDTDYSDLENETKATCRVDATFSVNASGVLMESGGAGAGVALVVCGGTVYCQVGEGSAGSDADTAEVSWDIPTTGEKYVIEWSADVATCTLALYVDGSLVGTDTFDHSVLSGTNVGGISRSHGDIAHNSCGFNNPTGSIFATTIHTCEIFLDEVTTGVQNGTCPQ